MSPLKLKANDGKYRLTDVCNIEDLENEIGESVVTSNNALNYEYVDEKEIEMK